MIVKENIDNRKINDIKNAGAGSWTEDSVRREVAYLATINPTLELMQVVDSFGRLECVVSGEFVGGKTVFQAPMPRLADCVISDKSLVQIVRDETQRASSNEEAKIRQQEREQELKHLAQLQKVADAKAKALDKITSTCDTVDLVVSRLISTMDNIRNGVEAPDFGMTFHIHRLTRYSSDRKGIFNICGDTNKMKATAAGQYIDIPRECCFMPQALELKFKAGAGWKCSSKAMAEKVVEKWNSHLPALQAVIDKK